MYVLYEQKERVSNPLSLLDALEAGRERMRYGSPLVRIYPKDADPGGRFRTSIWEAWAGTKGEWWWAHVRHGTVGASQRGT